MDQIQLLQGLILLERLRLNLHFHSLMMTLSNLVFLPDFFFCDEMFNLIKRNSYKKYDKKNQIRWISYHVISPYVDVKCVRFAIRNFADLDLLLMQISFADGRIGFFVNISKLGFFVGRSGRCLDKDLFCEHL